MTSLKMTNVKFTREQKNFLDEFFATKASEYNDKLQDEDDEEMSFESLVDMAKSVFNTKGFLISKDSDKGGKKPRKAKAKKADGPKRPINSYMRWLNAEGRTYIKEELKITDNKDILREAGKLWTKHKEDEDETFQKYDKMYQNDKVKFDELTSGGGKPTVEDEAGPAEDDAGPAEDEVKSYDLGKFTKFDDMKSYLNKYMRSGLTSENKSTKFKSLDDAYEAMKDDDEAVAVFLNKKGEFTLRKSCKMAEATETQVPCVVWVKKDPDSDSDSD